MADGVCLQKAGEEIFEKLGQIYEQLNKLT